MFYLKRITEALECLVALHYERNEMLIKDMDNEEKFKDKYLSIMGETADQLIEKFEGETK